MTFDPVTVTIKTKTDARRIVRLCRAGEHVETWKPEFDHFVTTEGQIRKMDYERAQDILMGVCDPDPGRPSIHNWTLIDALIAEVADPMPKPINQAQAARRVSDLYKERHGLTLYPENSGLRDRIRNALK